jgi:Hexameric tyrosine-coordinated heme protein (HTHP)
MNRVPDSELVLVPGGTLITATAEDGRAFALKMARHMIHNLQPDLDTLKRGRSFTRETQTISSLPVRSQLLSFNYFLRRTIIGGEQDRTAHSGQIPGINHVSRKVRAQIYGRRVFRR